MDPLEVFIVHSEIDSESTYYKKIIEDVMTDLRLAGSIGRIRVELKPEDSLYLMAIMLRNPGSELKVIDVAELRLDSYNDIPAIFFAMQKERYLPALLKKLWDRYGKSEVSQVDRWTIALTVDDPREKMAEVSEIIVDDPKRRLHEDLVDFAMRVTPEGFRVRYHEFKGMNFIFAGSEEAIKTETIEEVKEMLEGLKEAKN